MKNVICFIIFALTVVFVTPAAHASRIPKKNTALIAKYKIAEKEGKKVNVMHQKSTGKTISTAKDSSVKIK